jgi:hypothetical protein
MIKKILWTLIVSHICNFIFYNLMSEMDRWQEIKFFMNPHITVGSDD